MNSFEINKIITAILVTILVVFGIGKISNIIFDKDDKNIVAYKVEAPEGEAVQASTESSVDISALLAMGDAAHGEKFLKSVRLAQYQAKSGNKIGLSYGMLCLDRLEQYEYKCSKALSSYGKRMELEEMNGF